MSAAQEAARRYVQRGFVPIPLPAGSKNPGRPGWQDLRITLEEIPDHFDNGQNIGLLTGEPSGWLVDVDLDSDEAAKLAGRFLPPTQTSGRKQRRHTHWWYRAPGIESRDFKDTNGSKLVEIRANGRQTIVAPSVHPTGDEYIWHLESGLPIEEAEAGELAVRVRELATATLVARHLPVHREHGGGGRHDYALALSGFLLRPGRLDEGTTLKILLAAWDAKGYPGEREKREAHRDLEGVVHDTASSLLAGRPVVGGPTLEEVVPRMPRTLARFWGWGAEPEAAPDPERNGHHGGILLSEVIPERVEWLWPGRIPLGKLTVIDGDPGLGKSVVTVDLTARVSVGRTWPDGTKCNAGGVVILSAEDGLADTIRPRFDAAGGDPEKAVALSTVPDSKGNERQIGIPGDLRIIEAAIERVGALLVVIDPLMAFLSGDVNSHRDQDVRRALAPLSRLAERTGAAVVVVRHLNKAAGGNALYRGGGSIGIVGAARSGLLVAKHPDDDGRRVMASIKSNLAPPAPSLAFGLSGAANGAVRVEWKGESSLSAAALLAASSDPEERSVLQEAKDLLRGMLSEGPVPAEEVKREAGFADISLSTLKSAKQELGVITSRKGEPGKRGGGRWLWGLPPDPANIKGSKPEVLSPKSDTGRAGAKNSAYPSRKQPGGLRVQSTGEIKGVGDHCPLNQTLPVEAVAGELRRQNSGPALALQTYLQKPCVTRLEWLTKAVLAARRMDTGDWERHAETVRRAADDAAGCS